MQGFYDRFMERENAYYRSLDPAEPTGFSLTPAALQEAIAWLCDGSGRILDFGCGSGGLSFACAFCGAQEVLGIDLAEEGIHYAKTCAQNLPQCRFLHGSVEVLKGLPDQHFDGLILSNILDNMRPEDAMDALKEAARALKPQGKVFVKLNPVLTAQQIKDWNIQILEDNLLDDGLLLWNKNDAFWQTALSGFFSKVTQKSVYFEEADQYNRMFLCVK